MTTRPKSIAILGGGPAGAALGALLAPKGYKTAIFHTDKRPPLIVGESLLPAVVPFLRELGIEDDVKSFSIYKPGAVVSLSPAEIIAGTFATARGNLPDYAYNTPRDQFDSAVLQAAQRRGAIIFRTPAKLEPGPDPDSVRLTAETLDQTHGFFNGHPDLIVDATGRLRLIARLLDAPAIEGGRKDVALFAHLDKAALVAPNYFHLDLLSKGWAWRIPLPGKVSVGFVINPAHLQPYGPDVETQYDSYLQDEPTLRMHTAGSRRLTPVVKYNNYQLVSQRMYGPGWAMIGDAAGFVDPVFSSGVFLSLTSAFALFHAIEAGMTPRALHAYQSGRIRDFDLWKTVIGAWYAGTLPNLYRATQQYKNTFYGRIISRRFERRLFRILSGQPAADPLSMHIFRALLSFGTLLRNPADLAVK